MGFQKAFYTSAVLLITCQLFSVHSEKCLVNRQEEIVKKYINYEGKSLPLTLETSRRPSHRIVTNIFKIFVQEVLSYPHVNIIDQTDQFNITSIYMKIGNVSMDKEEYINNMRAMINLEVWVPLQEDTEIYVEHYNILERGGIGVSGRFGWFIPQQLLKHIYNLTEYSSDHIDDIHWTLLMNENFTSHFNIDVNQIIKQSVELKNPFTYSCKSPYCKDGMFIPTQCEDSHKCAVLLAPHYEDTHFLIEHIKQLNLLVKVIWLSSNLQSTYDLLMNMSLQTANKAFLMFSWTPSEIITPEKDFVYISFPNCKIINSIESVGCKYEINRLLKVSWSKLKFIAKPVYDALQDFTFTTEDYEDLFHRYKISNNKSDYEIACHWIRDKENVIMKTWKPRANNIKIHIGGIFPFQGNRGSVSDTAHGIVVAAKMAKTAVNKSPLLQGYELNMLQFDGKCKSDQVMKSFIDYVRSPHYDDLVGILGPACSETVEPLAGVSKFFKTIIISYSAEGVSFSDRKKYPYFFRTVGENKHFIPVYQSLFKKLNWKRIAALTEDGQKYTEYVSHLQDTLDINGISFISKKFPRERPEHAMKKYLKDLKYNQWKIIIADVNDDVARTVMCEAYKLNMTAQYGYVWFLPLWLSKTWYNTTYYNIINNESINCTSEMMLEAINGHLGLTHAFFASNNSIMQENITVSEWRKKYTSICQLNTEPSNYAGYAYDAVWTYAIALDKLIKQDPEAISKIHSPDITDKLVNIIQQTDFNGVSGRIKFYDGPSRYSIIHIVQWINYTTKIVGSYYPDISNNTHNNGNLNLNISEINWFVSNAKIPDDGTKPPRRCVLEGLAELLNVECEIAVIIANIIGFGFLVAILVIALYIVKRKYDQKVLLTQKYMRSLGIDLLNTSSMDKWEIQRDQVVINRKLGEGAFGTVYGGEAHFDDRGWVGVAVKTLKIGSTTEEKLDFLSEAEIMKRFDHKNIVKLLGVCTQSEPVYTIMEFMLYGDLKTFLLARRHLVNDRSTEDNDEISSKKLTSMALDIARALSYLAEMKFVHRDVACRNCLLNAQRMVKLGDFGMTRPMFENDYYKFNRKGMLPVRWMAPESLSLGIFTPSTDVWSFGVLLYEIITFGSFPFQGMSNYQVLEHVKEGNALKIPSAVKPQLEELIQSCWNLEQKYRPSASEIVEFLANNPRLLSPCLDAPLSSVQIEEINHELEMQLPESFRKFSVDPKINQNQITSPSLCTLPPVSVRQESISNVVISDIESIPLERSCVKEPLLGSSFSQYDSENEHNKFVKLKQNDDYLDTDAYGVHALSVL